MHKYENHVQVFMCHVKTENLAFIDKNLLEQFCHPLCTENDHSAVLPCFQISLTQSMLYSILLAAGSLQTAPAARPILVQSAYLTL